MIFNNRPAGFSKSRFDEIMRIHLLYVPDPEDRCVFSSKDCCVPSSKNCCVPSSKNCCVPSSKNCCVPSSKNCCVPSSKNCCVPSSKNCCVPSSKKDCSPKKIVEDFYSFFSRDRNDPTSRGTGIQTQIWESASELESYIERSLSPKQTGNTYHIIIPLVDLKMYESDTYSKVVHSLIEKEQELIEKEQKLIEKEQELIEKERKCIEGEKEFVKKERKCVDEEKSNLDTLYIIPLILSEEARGFLNSDVYKQVARINKDENRMLSLKKQRLIIASIVIKKLLWGSIYDKDEEKERLTVFFSHTRRKGKAKSQMDKSVENFKNFIVKNLNPVEIFLDSDSIFLGENFSEKIIANLGKDTLVFVF